MSFHHPSKRIFIPIFFAVTLSLAFLNLTATAQVKSKKLISPPKIMNSPAENREQLLAASPILKLIDQAAQESPLAFVWQLNTDTLLKANNLFRQLIEFDGGATIREAMAIDTITLKKSPEAEYDVRRNFLSYSTKMTTCNISQQKGKMILTLENVKSNDKQYFKVFLNKAANKILKIQNLKTGRFYTPVPFEGPTISL